METIDKNYLGHLVVQQHSSKFAIICTFVFLIVALVFVLFPMYDVNPLGIKNKTGFLIFIMVASIDIIALLYKIYRLQNNTELKVKTIKQEIKRAELSREIFNHRAEIIILELIRDYQDYPPKNSELRERMKKEMIENFKEHLESLKDKVYSDSRVSIDQWENIRNNRENDFIDILADFNNPTKRKTEEGKDKQSKINYKIVELQNSLFKMLAEEERRYAVRAKAWRMLGEKEFPEHFPVSKK